MFAAIGRSFRLIRESDRVLRQDPELIWLAMASFVAVTIVAGVLGGFGLSIGAFSANDEPVSGPGYVLIAIGYFLGYFAIIYFQVALVAAVMHRMDGNDPDLRYALGQANRRLSAIVMWAAIAATVGLLLRALEGMARGQSGAGRIVASIVVSTLGISWGLMVFFVIPVIVVEQTSGVEAIKRSSSTLKKKFGEAIIGNQGIGLIMFLATLVFAGIPLFIGLTIWNANTVVGGVIILIAVGIGVLIAAGGSALDSTYRAVLYRYATVGDSGQFSRTILDSAFRPSGDLRHSANGG
jgi:membrane-anchored glycerophosphoryl diester phosphodiesterase (GDPDase)